MEPDVAALVKKRRKARGEPLAKILNQALRESLRKAPADSSRENSEFRTPTADLGACLLPNLDCAGEVLDLLDEEDARQK